MNAEQAIMSLMDGNNQGLSIKETSNIDHFTDYTDITKELMYLDKTIVRENFSGNTLAGEPVVYSISRWGQLDIKIGEYKLAKSTKRIVLDALCEGYFHLKEEVVINGVWSLEKGVLFPAGTPIVGSFLYRGNMVIGFFQEGTNVGKTIEWYEKAMYGSSMKSMHRTHRVKDFAPETPSDVYDRQAPEFTKEAELNEILEFITSLKRRVLSAEEEELLTAIGSEVGMIIE